MRKLCSLTAVLALLLTTATLADGPRPKRGDVVNATPDTFNAAWVKGVSQDGGPKGQSIKMTDFAFYSFRNWWDHDLADVSKIQASWLLQGTNLGGSPRLSLQIAPPVGTRVDEDVLFLDPAWCSDPAPTGSWVESDFTDDSSNCTLHDGYGNAYTSDANGTAWEKVVAAYPDYTVWFLFAIQDATTGSNYLDRVKLDSAFFTSSK